MFYVLRGRGTALQDGERVPVQYGDVISYPSGARLAHTFFGGWDGNDAAFYPRSGKVVLRARSRALREQATAASKSPGLVGRVEETEYREGER